MDFEQAEPRLGAAFASRCTEPGVRVFGVVSTDGTAAGLLPLVARVGAWSSMGGQGEHLWMVGSTVQERLAWAPVPVGPSSLVGREAVGRSVMRLRIVTSDSAGGAVYTVDLGQSLEVVAASMQVELWAPQGSVVLTGDDAQVVPQQGLLFESQCLVRLLRLEASRGACSALLTETMAIPGGQAHAQRVPAGARRLTAYASPLATVPAWQWLRGDPAAPAVPLGTVAWSLDRPRTEVDVPSATHLRIDPDPADRVFTLVWTIHP
ncbi:MAG: hypothetical protein KDK70_17265 [Myxococcales bacterium]|nr:hypothetical protein [Myxococcales bacterium]